MHKYSKYLGILVATTALAVPASAMATPPPPTFSATGGAGGAGGAGGTGGAGGAGTGGSLNGIGNVNANAGNGNQIAPIAASLFGSASNTTTGGSATQTIIAGNGEGGDGGDANGGDGGDGGDGFFVFGDYFVGG